MDYNDFIPRDRAFKGFVDYRKTLLEAGDKGKFVEAFIDVCTKALSSDAIAQDCVAYFFNKGFPDYLKPNYQYYLSWQILAGANGNEFALEKLEFFLKPALDYILNDDDLLRTAMFNNNINKDNAIAVISNLICEGIVDEMEINPKNLIDIKKNASFYSPEKVRPFSKAMEKALPKVIEFLES